MYEGYGPAGVAVLCSVLTDNRNRTAGELRRAFEVCGGNLGASGCVSYLFTYKGLFLVPVKHVAEEQLMEVVLETGADDMEKIDDFYEITCDPKLFDDVRASLEAHKVPVESAETTYIASNYVAIDAEAAKKMTKLRDLLDENDDVQDVYSNEEMPEGFEG
jgi:YebC/PmpR family DNA-binding regulatory protein